MVGWINVGEELVELIFHDLRKSVKSAPAPFFSGASAFYLIFEWLDDWMDE
jgi:hypothetical protein